MKTMIILNLQLNVQRVGKLQEFHEISGDDRSCFLS